MNILLQLTSSVLRADPMDTIKQSPARCGNFTQEKGPGDESGPFNMVERMRIELTTSALRTQRSPS